MTTEPAKPLSGFPDVKQVVAALVRSAQRAKQIAEQTGTILVVGEASVRPAPLLRIKRPEHAVE